ncbi:purine-binding chemotaxis protein CheW [Catalinimonas alkaloidigena]|uniref:Purine-binding chemotaxis protein CheW n=1 Tax=Catalinimonas alkaloidigena TaxID=1075417 RepID=A0A1G9BSD9_9BACT|nr:chemotaxis protein CheW [Catalinimonas alkaloidigena]SDK42421.1 purine-binding chemotaxis protein CheW [Catalinimonas alkaloidigena]
MAQSISKEKEPQAGNSGPRIQLVVFRLGEEEYALSIDQIKEVVLTPNVARIPQTPDHIKGVANIRGNVLAILDLEKKFGIKSTDESLPKYTLVLESQEASVGILVRKVPNTLSIGEHDIDTASSVVLSSEAEEQAIRGIVKSGERMIILIDALAMLSRRETQEVAKSL